MLDFHRGLITDAMNYGRIKAIVMAKNESMPMHCTHDKCLVIQSVLLSAKVPPADKRKIESIHNLILSDPAYAGGGIL